VRNPLPRPFGLHRGETGLVLALGLVLLGNAAATQISGIVAVAGFLNKVGVNELLLVWIVDYALIFAFSGLQSLFIDRFSRVVLIRWAALSLAAVFGLLRLLFALGAPSWLSYSLLYLLSDLQWLLFPLVFWVLANDTLEIAQTKRLLPLIGSFGHVGKVIGIVIAALSPELLSRLGAGATEILDLNVAFYVVIFGIVAFYLRHTHLRRMVPKREPLRKTLNEGLEFARLVPAFRYLMLSIVALIAVDLIIEFRFYVVSDQVFREAGSYQIFYSLYRLAFTVGAIIIQSLVTSRLVARLGVKNALLLLPLSGLVGVSLTLIAPGIISSVGAMILEKLPRQTVDETAQKSFQALVPEERRGRVSLLMDSYLYAVGSIIGCVLTGALVLVGIWLGISQFFYAYLAVALVAALVAVWAVLKTRQLYDASMFNWRLKRRHRATELLDRLNF
jgi:AAA family ATP:ADP antiporter